MKQGGHKRTVIYKDIWNENFKSSEKLYDGFGRGQCCSWVQHNDNAHKQRSE